MLKGQFTNQNGHLFTLVSFLTYFFYEMEQATGKYFYCFFQINFFFTNTKNQWEPETFSFQ